MDTWIMNFAQDAVKSICFFFPLPPTRHQWAQLGFYDYDYDRAGSSSLLLVVSCDWVVLMEEGDEASAEQVQGLRGAGSCPALKRLLSNCAFLTSQSLFLIISNNCSLDIEGVAFNGHAVTALRPRPVPWVVEINETRNLIWARAGDAGCRLRVLPANVPSWRIHSFYQHYS